MVEFDEIQSKTNQARFIYLELILKQTKQGLVFPTPTIKYILYVIFIAITKTTKARTMKFF